MHILSCVLIVSVTDPKDHNICHSSFSHLLVGLFSHVLHEHVLEDCLKTIIGPKYTTWEVMAIL